MRSFSSALLNGSVSVMLTLFLCTTCLHASADGLAWQLKLDDPARSQQDRERDAGRKPVQVLEIFGVKAGMRVLDMFASGGYYTEVLAHRVGSTGEVLSHNNEFLLTVMDGRFNVQMTQRLAGNRLPNVTPFHKEFGSIGLNEEIDIITLVLNYHDLYNTMSAMERQQVLAELHLALKPGGILGIVDMQENPGTHDPSLHRVNDAIVKSELHEAGFSLVAESDLLRNPDDDHSLVVFNPAIRGKTDRYILKFQK